MILYGSMYKRWEGKMFLTKKSHIAATFFLAVILIAIVWVIDGQKSWAESDFEGPHYDATYQVSNGKLYFDKSKGAKGYQILYANNGKFKSGKKKLTSKTAGKIKNLKSGQNCYVKVRAYKMSGSKKVYGKYSSARKVRIK